MFSQVLLHAGPKGWGERFFFLMQLPAVFPCPHALRAGKTNAGEPETVKTMPVSVRKRTLGCQGRDGKAGGRTAVPTASIPGAERKLWGTTDITFPSQEVPSRHPGLSATPQLLQELLLEVVLGMGS